MIYQLEQFMKEMNVGAEISWNNPIDGKRSRRNTLIKGDDGLWKHFVEGSDDYSSGTLLMEMLEKTGRIKGLLLPKTEFIETQFVNGEVCYIDKVLGQINGLGEIEKILPEAFAAPPEGVIWLNFYCSDDEPCIVLAFYRGFEWLFAYNKPSDIGKFIRGAEEALNNV